MQPAVNNHTSTTHRVSQWIYGWMVVQIDCLFVNIQGIWIISSLHETDDKINIYVSVEIDVS